MNERVKKWLNVKAQANTDAPVDVFIYDAIDDWFGQSAKAFIEAVKPFAGRHLNLHLNSPGGSVFEGLAIYNHLKQRGSVTIYVDGIAASIASIIALAGDKIVMGKGTFLMVHNPFGVAFGESEDMRKTAETLDKISGEMAEIYKSATGAEDDTVKAWMDDETWFTADDAKAAGFPVESDDDAEEPAQARFSSSFFAKAPPAAMRLFKTLNAAPKPAQQAGRSVAAKEPNKPKKEKAMTYQQMIEARRAALDKVIALKKKETDGVITEAEIDALASAREESATLLARIEREDADNAAAKKQEEIEAKAKKPAVAAVQNNVRPTSVATDQERIDAYSFGNAFKAALFGEKLEGFEKEMHEEGVKEMAANGQAPSAKSVVIPQMVLQRSRLNPRAAQTATGGTGGNQGGVTVATEVGSVIWYLSERLVMAKLGATFLPGLRGNLSLPKIIRDDKAVEKAETATAGQSDPTWSSVNFTPHRLPVFMEFSDQLRLQSSALIEQICRENIVSQIARRMESQAISGDGVGANVTGLLATTGVNVVEIDTNGGAPTWATIVNLEGMVADDDADFGNLAYLTNSAVRAKLKQTLKPSSTAAQFIWTDGEYPLNGYRAEVTNLVPKNLTKGTGTGLSAAVFGNWADATFAQWGGIELQPDPFTKAKDGVVVLNGYTFFDFGVRHPESFAVCKEIATA